MAGMGQVGQMGNGTGGDSGSKQCGAIQNVRVNIWGGGAGWQNSLFTDDLRGVGCVRDLLDCCWW